MPNSRKQKFQEVCGPEGSLVDHPEALFAAGCFQQGLDERGLAGAHLPGEDDEAQALGEAVLQIGPGQFVLGAEIEKIRVGDEGEGALPQPVEFFVHQRLSQARQPFFPAGWSFC
jgi:hypothetical protein